MIVNWTPTSTDGTYYSLGDNDIHLAAANPDSDHTTIHEGGHALMDAIYNDDFPPAPNCNPHSVFGPSSTGCAWTEGWAEWLPARVLNDPFYRWDNGASVPLESPSWTTGEAQGDTVEGRVAGALIDLSDNTNEAPWDRYGEAEAYGAQFEEIYATNLIQVSDTLWEYFNVDRIGEGDTGYLARTSLFASTINYDQRDPLFSLGELTRPSLSVQPSPHNYSYNTGSIYWSGVAIRGNNDNDLVVYDDAAQTTALASSAYAGSTIDYVLVDSNHRALGDYYPRAQLWSGSGPYDIEWAGNANTLPEGTASLSFGSGDVIQMRDVSVTGGVINYVRVVPSAGLDVEVLAHVSNSATPSSLVQPRSSNAATGSSAGAGGAESIQYSAPVSDWTALVVLNRGGSGNATVYRDQSAPTGASVEINGGAATTTNRDVNLALAATDGQTGMMDMRISVDGVFDSETWEPYSTSGTATLPEGAGTKTVTVQFRNNAGAVSTASDTIDYAPATVPEAPTVTDSTPSAGAVTVAFTPGADGGSPVDTFYAQCVSTNGGDNGITTGTTSPITVTGLSGGKDYHCRVKARNAIGTGPYGAFGDTVTVPTSVPAAVTVTDSTPAGGRVTVAFTPGSDGGDPINLYYAQCVSTDGGVTQVVTGTSSPITVTGLTGNKNYRCRVKARNGVGVGPYGSYGATVLVPPATVPGQPSVTSSTPGVNKVTVAFTPGSDGGSPINLYYAQCVSSNGGVNKIVTGTSSPIVVRPVSGEKDYRCRVKARNAVGIGSYGAYGTTVTIPTSAPDAPTVTSSTPGPNRVTVAFTPGLNGGSPVTLFYAQCVSTNGGTNKVVTGGASPIAVTGLTSGRNYHCRVKARNAIGIGAYGSYGTTVGVP